MERRARHADSYSLGLLEELWRSDPAPERTLSLQADILAALESGSADYLPETPLGKLGRISGHCPWPGVFHVMQPVAVGVTELAPGDRFVLAVGTAAATFTRALVLLSGVAISAALADEEATEGASVSDIVAMVGAIAAASATARMRPGYTAYLY
jgi:hypothetical protein